MQCVYNGDELDSELMSLYMKHLATEKKVNDRILACSSVYFLTKLLQKKVSRSFGQNRL